MHMTKPCPKLPSALVCQSRFLVVTQRKSFVDPASRMCHIMRFMLRFYLECKSFNESECRRMFQEYSTAAGTSPIPAPNDGFSYSCSECCTDWSGIQLDLDNKSARRVTRRR